MGEEEGAHRLDEIDDSGNADGEEDLEGDDGVDLADERPPQLRVLHHVRVQGAATAPTAIARFNVPLILLLHLGRRFEGCGI